MGLLNGGRLLLLEKRWKHRESPDEENWFAIYSGTTCVRPGVKFTAGFYPYVRRRGIRAG